MADETTWHHPTRVTLSESRWTATLEVTSASGRVDTITFSADAADTEGDRLSVEWETVGAPPEVEHATNVPPPQRGGPAPSVLVGGSAVTEEALERAQSMGDLMAAAAQGDMPDSLACAACGGPMERMAAHGPHGPYLACGSCGYTENLT